MEELAESIFSNYVEEPSGYRYSSQTNFAAKKQLNREKLTVSQFLGTSGVSPGAQFRSETQEIPGLSRETENTTLEISHNNDDNNDDNNKVAFQKLRTSQHYIGKKGYVIMKEKTNIDVLNDIKKELSVSPMMKGAPKWVQRNAPVIKVFMENEKKMYVPRFVGLEKLGIPERNDLRETLQQTRLETPRPFTAELRPAQVEVHESTYRALMDDDRGNGGLIQLPCGFGKTITAISLIARLGLRAIVVVHKDFLRTQWIRAIEQFMPEATIGVIQQNQCDVDKDIVIAMLQSISQKEYPPGTFEHFGISVYDECHHLGAEIFCRALFRVNTRHVLGLSATPNRKDGLSRVFHWFLGPVVVSRSHSVNQRVLVFRENWYSGLPEERAKMQVFYNKVSEKNTAVTELVSYLVELKERTEHIANMVVALWKNEPSRRILILSDRRAHLEYIAEFISRVSQEQNISTLIYGSSHEKESLREERKMRRDLQAQERQKKRKDAESLSLENGATTTTKTNASKKKRKQENSVTTTTIMTTIPTVLESTKDTDQRPTTDMTIGFYWGGAPQNSLDRAANCTVVLGSFNMASEGFDAPRLNTLILASPKSDVKQACGRILRRVHKDVVPLIVDIIDEDFERFRSTSFVRGRFYKECGFHYTEKLPYERKSDVTKTIFRSNTSF